MTPSRAHPAQKLCYPGHSSRPGLLLAAVGPYILSLDLNTGELLSKWPSLSMVATHEGSLNGSAHVEASVIGSSQTKKRKLGPAGNPQSDGSLENREVSARSQETPDSQNAAPALAKISSLLSTSDGKTAVAVTADDKCLRVFKLGDQGHLHSLSDRRMPKRPCTVVLTRDEKTVLLGDKFGDVYALPLAWRPKSDVEKSPNDNATEPAQPFKSSASELTVHTKGNRDALRQQQLQKVAARKQGLDFNYQIVLGHVSLLTDLTVGTDHLNGAREFILTADRDEHIRVSRGIPQAHIIENYCQAHTEFISKLCMVAQRPKYLVSAGGEPSLKVFDWLRGILVAEALVAQAFQSLVARCQCSETPNSRVKLAISCLQTLHFATHEHEEEVILIVFSFEGTPGVCLYEFDPKTHLLRSVGQIPLTGNVLDMVSMENATFLISLDNYHSSFSMKNTDPRSRPPTIIVLEVQALWEEGECRYTWHVSDPSHPNAALKAGSAIKNKKDSEIASNLQNALQLENCHYKISTDGENNPAGLYSVLGEFLYGLENLRKRAHEEQPEDTTEVVAAPEAGGIVDARRQ